MDDLMWFSQLQPAHQLRGLVGEIQSAVTVGVRTRQVQRETPVGAARVISPGQQEDKPGRKRKEFSLKKTKNKEGDPERPTLMPS